MNKDIEILQKMVNQSYDIVFFGGAGVSTESGIPDFRSKDGLYNQAYKYPPEYMLSHTCFLRNPEDFFTFYRDKILFKDKKPNKAHLKLAEMESHQKLRAIITQNIDGLHQAAGSNNVFELHGSIERNYCVSCGVLYGKDIYESEGIPICRKCGGIVRPDVVLYEEGLDSDTIDQALEAIKKADMLIIAGTSLTVYPASALVNYFTGKYLVIINKDETGMDGRANLVIRECVGETLSQIEV